MRRRWGGERLMIQNTTNAKATPVYYRTQFVYILSPSFTQLAVKQRTHMAPLITDQPVLLLAGGT